MNKKLSLSALAAITLLGSLFCILGSNMFFSDIGNIAASKLGLIVTFPALMFAALFPLAFFYVVRFYLRPKTFKKLTRLYLIIALALSGVGFITTLLTGIVVYGSFVSPYPFPGYVILFIILHLAVLGGGVFALLKVNKLPEDEEVFKVNVKHVFKTLGWFLFVCLVFNRFGMFVASPLYIHWRTFYMTFPFYLYLLFGACVLVLKVLVLFDVIKCAKLRMILSAAAIGLNIILFAVIAIIGVNNTAFISAVSPAMPLERLASKPVEIIIHFASYLAVSIILLVQSIKLLKNK